MADKGSPPGHYTREGTPHARARMSPIVTELVLLAREHQEGRVTSNVTVVTFNFTEGPHARAWMPHVDTEILTLTRKHQEGRVSDNDTAVSFNFNAPTPAEMPPIVTEVVRLAKQHQKGRVTDSVTNVTDTLTHLDRACIIVYYTVYHTVEGVRATDTQFKVRENKLRRWAKRLGLSISKSSARLVRYDNLLGYQVYRRIPRGREVIGGVRYELSFEEVEKILSSYEESLKKRTREESEP